MGRLAVRFVPVTLIFFVAQAVVLAGTRLAHPGEDADPFAPYETMMPGGPVSASGHYPCDFHSDPVYPGVRYSCESYPSTGPFAWVSSNIFEGQFVRTVFIADNLHVGDIVRHWGRPDVVVRFNYRSYYVLWADQGLVGFIDPVGPVGQFSYRMPVEYFTIGLNNPTTIP